MRRAFTLVELVTVLAILLLLVPLVYQLIRRVEETEALAAWDLSTADAIVAIDEAMREDARRGAPLPDAVGWDGCGGRYEVRGGALVRVRSDACGGTVALGRAVEAVAWAPGGVEVTFVRRLRPDHAERTTVLVPVEGR